MQKAKALFVLTRPINCSITFLSVWIGAAVAGDVYHSWRIVAASISAAMITGMGNAVNDILDITIDRINKPFRPLPSGMLSAREAWTLAGGLGIAGLLLSLFVSRFAPILALCVILLLMIYTPVFKGMSYFGNALVAFVSSLAFVYGGMAVDRPFGAIVLSAFALLLHFGREIIKDIQDMSADSAAGIRTGAASNGAGVSRIAATVALSLLAIGTIVPFGIGAYGLSYLIVVVVGVDSILVFAIYQLAKTDNEMGMRRIALWLKAAMPLGLAAVFIGSRGW